MRTRSGGFTAPPRWTAAAASPPTPPTPPPRRRTSPSPRSPSSASARVSCCSPRCSACGHRARRSRACHKSRHAPQHGQGAPRAQQLDATTTHRPTVHRPRAQRLWPRPCPSGAAPAPVGRGPRLAAGLPRPGCGGALAPGRRASTQLRVCPHADLNGTRVPMLLRASTLVAKAVRHRARLNRARNLLALEPQPKLPTPQPLVPAPPLAPPLPPTPGAAPAPRPRPPSPRPPLCRWGSRSW